MVIANTKSLCPQCLRVIKAEVVERDAKVYLRKRCSRHGEFETLHVFDIPLLYKEVCRIFYKQPSRTYPHDLIIYLNTCCNLECPLCYSNANELQLNEPSLGEIMAKLSRYSGRWVHLSGGEPTLREDLPRLIREIRNKGFRVGLFTNGKRLVDREYVYSLKEAGLELIILQFDTLDDNQYEVIRGQRLLDAKLQAVGNIKDAGIYLYLFCALIDGINSNQIARLVKYSSDNIEIVKILNFNPIWKTGRHADFPIMPHSRIYQEMRRQVGLTLEDFIAGTEFAHYCFEVYRKFKNESWTRQPPCAQRCYMVKLRGRLLPLTRIVDLERWNRYLSKLNDELESHSRFQKINLFLRLVYYFFLRELFFNRYLLRFLLELFKGSLRGFINEGVLRVTPSNIFSLMVGVFHNEVNIDLEIVKRCTLHADIFAKERHTAACVRQIYHNRKFNPPAQDTGQSKWQEIC
jgi:hypothetical protein